MLKFEDFYRRKGVRMLAQLLQPQPQQFQQLPDNIIYHYLPIGEQPKEPMLREAWLQPFLERDYFIEAVTQYPDKAKGYSRIQAVTSQKLVKNWVQTHPKSRFSQRPLSQTLTSPQQLGLVSYGYLGDIYVYPTTPQAQMDEFRNRLITLWDKIASMVKDNDRQHFVKFRVPDRMFGFRDMETWIDKELTLGARKLFPDETSLVMLDFWRWLDATAKPRTLAERQNPPVGVGRQMSTLSAIPLESLGRVNVIWETSNGMCLVMNLGYLNSWIKHQANLTDQRTVRQLASLEMRKLFWKFMQVAITQKVIDQPDVDAALPDNIDPATGAAIDAPLAEGGVAVKKNPGGSTEPSSTGLASDPALSESTDPLSDSVKSIDSEILDEEELNGNKDVNIEDITDLDQAKSMELAKARLFTTVDPQVRLMERLDAVVEQGGISAATYKTLRKHVDEHPNRPDPYGKFKTRREAAAVKAEDLAVDESKTKLVGTRVVAEECQSRSSYSAFQKGYIQNVLPRDVVSVIDHLQSAGMVIMNHEVRESVSQLGDSEVHSLQVRMIPGEQSTINFTIPKVGSNGYFMVNGVRYRQRTQRADVPIRKIGPDTVSLKSYKGGLQVTRNNRISNQVGEWIIRQIFIRTMGEQPLVKDLKSSNVYDNAFVSPYMYGIISTRYASFKIKRHSLMFDHTHRASLGFALKDLEKKGRVLCGVSVDKQPIVIDQNNELWIVRPDGEESLGDFFSLLQLNPSEAPMDFAEVSVFARSIPIVISLGYYLGVGNMLELLKVKHRWSDGNKRRELTPYEYAIRFADGYLILDRRQRHAALILAGLYRIEKTTKAFPFKEFNHPGVYFNALQELEMSQVQLHEIDRLLDVFIDPITRQNLELMGEPTTLPALFIRSVELLDTYHYPTSQDANYQVFRGYERFAGIVYNVLTKAIAEQQSKSATGRSKLNISPYAVKQCIQEDASLAPANEINPLQSIKEQEIVTYGGMQGRSKDGMNRASRAFHESDLGVVSLEGSIDSGDVGVNFMMSANPQLANMRGFIRKDIKLDSSNLLSTSAQVAPFTTQDDMKRAVFTGIQSSHIIAAAGYAQMPIRTGAEIQVVSRAGPMFANHAQADGVVEAVTDKGVMVRYSDGSSEGFSVGRTFGRSEGSVYPHDLIAAVKVGQKVVAGQVITYNPAFFEVDMLDPRNITTKHAKLVKVMLIEAAETHEDSAAISQRLANEFTTKNTKVVSIPVEFDQRIHQVVKVGQTVDPGQALLLIESSATANSDAYNEASLKTLSNMSRKAPESPVRGTIDRIEFNYHGSKEDMNVSLRQLADLCDRARVEEAKAIGKKTAAGAFDGEYRIAGEPMQVDNAEILIYITQEMTMGNADKLVLGNQLKGTTGMVMDREILDQYGDPVDVTWSYRSVAGRIVESPVLLGTGITLMLLGSKHMAKIYKGEVI